jgi:hypothetical protein
MNARAIRTAICIGKPPHIGAKITHTHAKQRRCALPLCELEWKLVLWSSFTRGQEREASNQEPRVFRHTCGYAPANKAIQIWLDHRSIASTAVDTALAPNRFRDFRRD